MVEPQSDTRRRPLRAALIAVGALVAALVVLVLAVGIGARRVAQHARDAVVGPDRTVISHAVVVERVRAVAQLVTSETTVRDVVVYENRRLGSTKRALVVVTGRITAGIDLAAEAKIDVDEGERRVKVALPRAKVLGVEVTELKTYDEQSGLWNRFRPADRDTLFRLAREQLETTATQLGTADQAERNAEQLLKALLGRDGYDADVTFGGRARPPDLPAVEPPKRD